MSYHHTHIYPFLSSAGIEVDVWANEPNTSINQLPISLLFFLHGRGSDRKSAEKIAERMLRIQHASPNSGWKRELIIASFVRTATMNTDLRLTALRISVTMARDS
jgi:hypothetical protein